MLTLLGIPSAKTSQLKPIIGMQYWNWFAHDQPGCAGAGWRDNPFQMSNVRSLVFSADPNGYCYSSVDPHTAFIHAAFLDLLNVSFVIHDEANLSKSVMPSGNPIFQGELKAMEGFRHYTPRRIRSAFMLSITCWAEQCHGQPGNKTEIFTFNDYVKAHITEIAATYLKNADDFQLVNGKPLLLFYISQGSNVKLLNGDPAFHGAGNIYPTETDFDYEFNLNGSTYRLRDFFSIRYAVVADSVFDYSKFSHELWPFTCNYGESTFTEVGYASLLAPRRSPNRDLNMFNQLVDRSRDKQFLVIRGWNEFSSTDEVKGKAYTIEPNTQLHKVDTTPGNMDPWYFFNNIKQKLNEG
jgi:hypothetical protein